MLSVPFWSPDIACSAARACRCGLGLHRFVIAQEGFAVLGQEARAISLAGQSPMRKILLARCCRARFMLKADQLAQLLICVDSS